MKSSTLLAFTAAALLAAGSAFAGPNCKKNKDQAPSQDEGVFEVSAEGEKKSGCKNKNREGSSDEGVFEVAERDGEAREGKKRERPEGDRRERKHHPLHGLDLSDEQKEDAKAIFESAKESSKALMEEIKAKKEAGEEIDRKAVHEQMMEIRKGAMKNVYDNVLNDDQRAKVDERRKKMEERRAEGGERKGGDGERPKRPSRDKGGDEGLDL